MLRQLSRAGALITFAATLTWFSVPAAADFAQSETWDVVVPERPVSWTQDVAGYGQWPLYGSAADPESDLTLRVDVDAVAGPGADVAEASNGIVVDNRGLGDDLRSIYLLRRGTTWSIGYQRGAEFPVNAVVFDSPDTRAQFTVAFTDGYRAVEVVAPDGTATALDVGEDPFTPDDAIRVSAQVAPGSTTTVHALALTQLVDPILEPSLADTAATAGVLGGSLPDRALGTLADERLTRHHVRLFLWHLDMPDDPADPTSAFADRQSQLAHAVAQGWTIRAHPLIWHEGLPDWLANGTFTRDVALGVMATHIDATVAAYPEVDEWVVVNEAVTADGLRDTVWSRSIGPDYVDEAFRLARAAAPGATLLYNDFDIEYPGPKADRVHALVAGLVARGVPIDGVGSQAHVGVLDAVQADRDAMRAELDRYAPLGLDTHITELDVNSATIADPPAAWRDVAHACVTSSTCRSIVTWGLNDRDSWLVQPHFAHLGPATAPLLYTADGTPKETFWEFLSEFQELGEPVAFVDVDISPAGSGSWTTSSDGAVIALDGAVHHGHRPALAPGEVVVALVPAEDGYWLTTSAGRVIAYGAAVDYGDVPTALAADALAAPVVDATPTPSGRGYVLLGADGGVFTFGDATFHGSVPGLQVPGKPLAGRALDAPVAGISMTPSGGGYWIIGADGGMFTFGDAAFHGSIPGVLGPRPLAAPIVGVVSQGDGYLMLGADGGVFAFGDAAFAGSLAGQRTTTDGVVSVAAVDSTPGYLLLDGAGGLHGFGALVAAD